MSLTTAPYAPPPCAPHPDAPCGVVAPAEVAEIPVAAQRGLIELDLPLRHSGVRRVRLRYEFLGSATLPAVFVAGGISARRHVAASAAFPESGWWDAQVGAGRPLDPDHHCIIAMDWLGSDGVLDVAIDPADQADAIAALLEALAIGKLAAFVGSSYGAMVGLQFAARHPQRLARLVAISGAHRADPHASARRALQRRAVALGALQCDDSHGLELARQLAILSYRTREEFAARFAAPARVVNGRVRVAAEDYLDHCGAKYVAQTPPAAFLRLSESIDLQALDPSSVRVPVTVVGIEEDRLVPLAHLRELVDGLGDATGSRLHELRSIYGHDAFLKETDAIGAIVRDCLDVACTAHPNANPNPHATEQAA